jgi:uncharacterized protein (TIGR03085 family)
MERFARLERQSLADALAAVPPDAPTLCAGWTARDLAAHIVLRERRPIAAGGIMFKRLAGLTDRVQRRLAAKEYAELVATVGQPPPLSPMRWRPLDELTNTLEFFIHTEDVLRAQPDWKPRELSAGLAKALWARVGGVARLATRRIPASITVICPTYGEASAGAGGPAVVVRGAPGEVTLFFSGRQDVAQVTVDGPPELVRRLSSARLGV